MLQGSVVGLGCGWKCCHQFPVVLSVCVFDSPSICFLGLIHHLLRVLSNSCCLPHLFKFITQVEFILIEDSSQLILQWRLSLKKKKKKGKKEKKSFDVLCLFQNLSSPLDRQGNPEKIRLSVLSVTGVTAQSFPQTLPKPCLMLVTPGGAQFAQGCGHAVTCWLLLHLSCLLESSAHLANLPSFYHCDSWILLSLILPSFFLSIYRVWNVRRDNYRMCWCLQTADGASTAGAASCTSPFLPTSSVLVLHIDMWEMYLSSPTLSVVWLSQGNADRVWAFVMVVTVWTCLHWSLAVVPENISQWATWCWGIEGKSDGTWKKGQGGICHPLVELKDLLSLEWSAHCCLAQDALLLCLAGGSAWGFGSSSFEPPPRPLLIPLVLPVAGGCSTFSPRHFFLPISGKILVDKTSQQIPIACWDLLMLQKKELKRQRS